MKTSLTTVCVACSLPVFRAGLRFALHATTDIHIVAEADDSWDTLKIVKETHPTVLLLEADLPGGGATALLRRLDQLGLSTATVLVVSEDSIEIATQGAFLNASLLMFTDTETEFVHTVRAAAQGRRHVSEGAANALRRHGNAVPLHELVRAELTPTENVVLGYLENGSTSRQIAEHLFISYRTVQKHRANIARKLGLAGSNALLTFALQRKQ